LRNPAVPPLGRFFLGIRRIRPKALSMRVIRRMEKKGVGGRRRTKAVCSACSWEDYPLGGRAFLDGWMGIWRDSGASKGSWVDRVGDRLLFKPGGVRAELTHPGSGEPEKGVKPAFGNVLRGA